VAEAPRLYAVPNVSEGADAAAIAAIGEAFSSPDGVELLDVHSDADHNRSVYWLAGGPGRLAEALAAGAKASAERIDLRRNRGVHPHVGALDVAPVVFLDDERRGAACAEALLAGARIAEVAGLPVYLYGILADGRTRAELRKGGLSGLRERGTVPDFGAQHPLGDRSGAVLVAARAPLIAFNLEIEDDLETAKAIAATIRRELTGVRALGLWLDSAGVAQVSTNVEDHVATPLPKLLEAVRAQAPVTEAELVGLAPPHAFDGWPDDVPVRNRRELDDDA
jgi:glutamate formiminotransferase